MKTAPLVVVACTLLFTGQLSRAQTPPAQSALTADPVYKKDCAKCHGKTAEGRFMGGPSLISGKAAAASADALRHIITDGKGHMPKFGDKLTAEEIDSLVKLIQADVKK
ncbi:MAG TPA: cytochrome c [Candidatus Eisenbacteria bacterium]|nr:cytochrome c [Candidatus Eisenbacteria bacterium]